MSKGNNKFLFSGFHEWFLRNCMNLDKQVRTINAPMKRVRQIIESFTEEIKWKIKVEYESDKLTTIRIENPETSFKRLFISRVPQIVLWRLINEGENLRIENICLHQKQYSYLIWFILRYSFIFATILILAGGYIPTGIGFALIFLFLSLGWLSTSGKPRLLIEDFYNKIEKENNTATVLVRGGSSNPNIQIYYIMNFILLFFMMIATVRPALTNFPILAILFVVIVCLLTPIIYFVYGTKARYVELVSIHITNFLTGGVFAASAIMPYLIMQSEKYFLHPPRGYYPLILIGCISYLIITLIKNVSITKDIERYEAKRIKLFEASERNPYAATPSKIFRITLFFMWIFCSTAVLSGTYFSISLLGKDPVYIIKQDYTTSSYAAQMAYLRETLALRSLPITEEEKRQERAKIRKKYQNGIYKKALVPPIIVSLMAFWCVPFLLVLMYSFWKWASETFALINTSKINKFPDSIERAIDKLSKYFKTATPQIIVENTQTLYSQIRVPFIWKPMLVISKGLLENLNDNQIDAILAHEMWHKKKHAFTLSIWNALFTVTMFGSNNSSVLTNSLELEYEADEQAVNFLKSQGKSESTLTDALVKIDASNESLLLLSSLDPSMAFHPVAKKENAGNNNPLNNFKKGLIIFSDIYFGRKNYGYIHPTLNQRIRRLKEKYA